MQAATILKYGFAMCAFSVASCNQIINRAVGKTVTTERVQKVVVNVATPNGQVTKTANIGFRTTCQYSIDGPGKVCSVGERAEAIPIDLVGVKTIYVLLGNAEDENQLCCAFKDAWSYVDGNGYKVFKRSKFPYIVTFKNENDKSSVLFIDPDNFYNNYRITEIHVEPGSGFITRGILSRLPWLNDIDDYNLSHTNNTGRSVIGSAPERLLKSDFIRGNYAKLS